MTAARGSLAAERAELEAAEASPEALAAGKEILEELMRLLGFDVRVEVETGETSRLNVVGDGRRRRRPSGPSSAARASACRPSSTSST